MSDSAYEENTGNSNASNTGASDGYHMTDVDDKSQVPIVRDGDTESGINPTTEDSDETLARDDTDAIDEDNIIEDRTRGAGPKGGYAEPGDEEGLPSDDGTSSSN